MALTVNGMVIRNGEGAWMIRTFARHSHSYKRYTCKRICHFLPRTKLTYQITILSICQAQIHGTQARVLIFDLRDSVVTVMGLHAAHFKMLCNLCNQMAAPSESLPANGQVSDAAIHPEPLPVSLRPLAEVADASQAPTAWVAACSAGRRSPSRCASDAPSTGGG